MSDPRRNVGGRLMPAFGRKFLAAAFGVTLGAALLSPVLAAPKVAVRAHAAATGLNSQVEVFVRLSTPSVAELNADAVSATGDLATDQAQAAQVAKVTAEQANMRGTLAAHGATILSSLKVGANGLRVKVAASEIESIKALPGVRSVGRVVRFRPNNITSVPAIGAPVVWEKYKAKGKGVTIGIIDSGIDYTHKNFGGPGTPEAYAANDPNKIEPGTFPTAKVVGGWDFAGASYDADDPTSVPKEDPDPLDGNNPANEANGHGSHVAGTAAGFGVPGKIGPGVAPEAKLYALKVFGDQGGSTNLVSDAIEWALDPNHDGNMRDHLDVINMSLGSDYGDPNDPSAISAENAAKLGIIVVTSAGNAGTPPYIVGSPSIAPSVISTAAVTPAGRDYSRVTVNSPASIAGVKQNLEGSSPVTVASLNPPVSGAQLVKVANAGSAQPDDGCTTITNNAAVTGNVALIIRGGCNFTVKVQNAYDAGARAVIVRNSGDPNASSPFDPIVMGLDDAKLAAVMISYADGVAIAAVATTTTPSPVTVTLDTAPDPTQDDQIATFSSRGPGQGGSTFKPDLSAPGVSIVSTAVATGDEGKNFQGTSMASPHVAGAAALLHQLHPNLKPDAIKALLQNSTVDANASSETNLARQGVGSIRVSKAADLTSYASPGGVSFGRLNPVLPSLDSETVTLYNMDSSRSRTFRVTERPHQTYPGVDVQCPGTVTVPRGGSAKFQIRLAFNPIATGKAGVTDDDSISQTEVDGWCVLSDGKDSLRVGYLAVVDAASNLLAFPGRGGKSQTILNLGPVDGLAEGFTFAGTGGQKHRKNDDNQPEHTLDDFGFRTADLQEYGGVHVAEFAVSLDQNYESLTPLNFEIAVDADGDGKPDVLLQAADLSLFIPTQAPGELFVTGFFDPVTFDGSLDWIVSKWDFNDRTVILPFTKAVDGGGVPNSFKYTLTVNDNGGSDAQKGKIDFANELVPDLNDFVLNPLGSADVSVTGKAPGKLLWFFRNNALPNQEVTQPITPPRK